MPDASNMGRPWSCFVDFGAQRDNKLFYNFHFTSCDASPPFVLVYVFMQVFVVYVGAELCWVLLAWVGRSNGDLMQGFHSIRPADNGG